VGTAPGRALRDPGVHALTPLFFLSSLMAKLLFIVRVF